ncbi:MAG: hypothetical protein ABIX01_03965 [Chitinophagaceae bacterium]
MKRKRYNKLFCVLLMVLFYGCASGDDKKTAGSNAINEERLATDSMESRSSEPSIISIPPGTRMVAEAVAKTTALRDSIDALIGNMQATVNYDTLRANGSLNFFNASINDMRMAKNRISLDLDKIIIKDLNISADKLSAVTGQMRKRKDDLSQFSQRIEKIASGIKSLVDIAGFLATNGYLKPTTVNSAVR